MELRDAAGRKGALLFAFAIFCGSGCGVERPSTAAPSEMKIIKTKSGIEMVQVPAGSFQMGSDQGAADEAPRHQVTVDSFLIDRFEVSQEQYEKFVIGNPSKFKSPKNPVERVRWVEAALYCNARSTDEGLEPCYNEETFECKFTASGYRLPTEAEWEYASRAGNDDESSSGGDAKLAEGAWFRDNSAERTHPVGTKRANAWGLYDMAGNVGEWCQDIYAEGFYKAEPAKNPCSLSGGSKRILRGGSWSSTPDKCRSHVRAGEEPGSFADACFARPDIGFRCVRRAPDDAAPQKLALTAK